MTREEYTKRKAEFDTKKKLEEDNDLSDEDLSDEDSSPKGPFDFKIMSRSQFEAQKAQQEQKKEERRAERRAARQENDANQSTEQPSASQGSNGSSSAPATNAEPAPGTGQGGLNQGGMHTGSGGFSDMLMQSFNVFLGAMSQISGQTAPVVMSRQQYEQQKANSKKQKRDARSQQQRKLAEQPHKQVEQPASLVEPQETRQEQVEQPAAAVDQVEAVEQPTPGMDAAMVNPSDKYYQDVQQYMDTMADIEREEAANNAFRANQQPGIEARYNETTPTYMQHGDQAASTTAAVESDKVAEEAAVQEKVVKETEKDLAEAEILESFDRENAQHNQLKRDHTEKEAAAQEKFENAAQQVDFSTENGVVTASIVSQNGETIVLGQTEAGKDNLAFAEHSMTSLKVALDSGVVDVNNQQELKPDIPLTHSTSPLDNIKAGIQLLCADLLSQKELAGIAAAENMDELLDVLDAAVVGSVAGSLLRVLHEVANDNINSPNMYRENARVISQERIAEAGHMDPSKVEQAVKVESKHENKQESRNEHQSRGRDNYM
ncbi:UNVERIFIED_CONTAM: hypothetical protein HDU68_010279 [Siphonaria sp. JEL0065]|nr:hypothetical protein HDU68_010279 [Siphonaria sp. JEL0065]